MPPRLCGPLSVHNQFGLRSEAVKGLTDKANANKIPFYLPSTIVLSLLISLPKTAPKPNLVLAFGPIAYISQEKGRPSPGRLSPSRPEMDGRARASTQVRQAEKQLPPCPRQAVRLKAVPRPRLLPLLIRPPPLHSRLPRLLTRPATAPQFFLRPITTLLA